LIVPFPDVCNVQKTKYLQQGKNKEEEEKDNLYQPIDQLK